MSAITTGFISSDDYDTAVIQELKRKTPKKRTNEDPFPEDASTQISSFKFQDNSTRENVEIKIHQVIIALYFVSECARKIFAQLKRRLYSSKNTTYLEFNNILN